MGVGSSFWRRLVLFLFVCLFFNSQGGWLFCFKSHKWVRFSCLFCVCVGVCVCVCVLCCFSFKMLNSPPPAIYLGSGWYFFLSRRLVKFFAFFYFCLFVFILFCFVLFCFFVFLPKIPSPPWYQMVRPYLYSITQMMVDITSSTILNSRAIQWKI